MDKNCEQKIDENNYSEIKRCCNELAGGVYKGNIEFVDAPIPCVKLSGSDSLKYLGKYAKYSKKIQKSLSDLYDKNYAAFGEEYKNWILPYSLNETTKQECGKRIINIFLYQALKYPGIKPNSKVAKLWDIIKPKMDVRSLPALLYQSNNFKDAMEKKDEWIKRGSEEGHSEINVWIINHADFDDIMKTVGSPPTKGLGPLSLKETIVLWLLLISKEDLKKIKT
jgi:hypothetical protein